MGRTTKRPAPIYRDSYQAILKKIRKARQVAKMTQQEASEALGRARSWVAKLESGERRIDPIDLVELALLYDVSITTLLPADSLVLKENTPLNDEVRERARVSRRT